MFEIGEPGRSFVISTLQCTGADFPSGVEAQQCSNSQAARMHNNVKKYPNSSKG